ncbi:hypothetical protein SAMN05421803_1432 [Nocardiopsis flavescens]|uniref:Uncharacterized protein n=2 Tax=Nocardiopsis flavescens TaxID=758803 RepID=A0A1M6WE96_9ACTN|nr:hypothetical protein SAMN05421803_1432 [Nocardiopsis flavescens]
MASMSLPDPPPPYGRTHREARSAWVSDHGALPALLREAPSLARYPLAAARISWAVCSAVLDARTLRREPRALEVGEVVRPAAVAGVLPAELAIIVLGARRYPTLLGTTEDLRLLEQVGPDLLTEWPPGP